ncbi:TetR/AcrR family transcriptional regulator [Pseudomonadota bacterium AL_CKDN230030165-1A_HGKHYDSX7]
MSTATDTSNTRETILAHGQRLMASKGFSAVGLNEILTAASVPKGSFYHYFASKDAFGEAMLDAYFETYLGELDDILSAPGQTMAERLTRYWDVWQDNQSFSDCQGKCLAVKLGAEVADLSEAMRLSLKRGVIALAERLARAIEAGVAEGSLSIEGTPQETAESLYELWLGASIMVKIVRNPQPFVTAMAMTRKILNLSG